MDTKLAVALLAPVVMLLTGCLLTPGKFTSELQVMSNGNFAYRYDGEIQMLALSKLAEMGNGAPEVFEAESCYDDDWEERACTSEEIAEQKAEWDAGAQARAEEKKRKTEQAEAFLGGIDPSSPEAAKEFAERLQRQRGWTKVDYLGDGLFDVEFAISGVLSHDFAFPTIEKLPLGSSFVGVTLRDDNQIRIDAPGFAAQGAGNPMQGMMSGMAGLAGMAESTSEDGKPMRMVLPEGTFTIVTDGRILANNTDEGPKAHANGQVLMWEISPRTEAAPTALIGF